MDRKRPYEWWTGTKERAVDLVAEGALTNQQIADTLGIGTATLTRWKRRQDFKDRVAERVASIGRELRRLAIQRACESYRACYRQRK